MRFFFLNRLSPSTSLLIVTGLFISVLGVRQDVFAQSPAVTPAPKEIANIKPALSLDTVFKALRSDKAAMPQKNQILILAVKERGLAFVLTKDVEDELTKQGASTLLIDTIRKESEKAQSSAYFYRERGDDLRFKKQFLEAIESYNKTLEIDPEDRIAYNNRGRAFEELKRYDEALADFSKVIELDSTDRNGYHNRGVVYYNLNQYQKAIDDYSKSIELDPKFVEAYIHRAAAYQMTGRRELAEADRRMAKSLRP